MSETICDNCGYPFDSPPHWDCPMCGNRNRKDSVIEGRGIKSKMTPEIIDLIKHLTGCLTVIIVIGMILHGLWRISR